MSKAVLAIHGGAGAISRRKITPALQYQYESALQAILAQGEQMLASGASALDIVTEAVRRFEECSLFNAGHGAVFTREAEHELDASIMDGKTRNGGAVAGLRTSRNPVLAARAVMERSPHVFLIGEGADTFAQEHGVERVDSSFFSTDQRYEQLQSVQETGMDTVALDHDDSGSDEPIDQKNKMGTVGAVALDEAGNLAAATSTGGVTNKWPGRVGDSPIIGAGCYADNTTCAVSCTGMGEAFIRAVAAYDVSALMAYSKLSLSEAANQVVHEKLPSLGGTGGIIALDGQGNVTLPFNSEGMYRGSVVAGGVAQVAIYR